MATADQVKSLIKAHIEQDDERFKTITLQIAANEARHGHDTFARELKQYAEKIGKGKKNLIRLNNNGNGMFLVTYPSERLSDLVVSSEIQERIERLLIEYRNRNKLQKYGLSNRRKILIEGRPGTGKTFTASVIYPFIQFRWTKSLPSSWAKQVPNCVRFSIIFQLQQECIFLTNLMPSAPIEVWTMKLARQEES